MLHLARALVALTAVVALTCRADDALTCVTPATRLDAQTAFTGQDTVIIQASGKPCHYDDQLDATPLILDTVRFEGEVLIAPGATAALNAFVVARRGRSPLDFANLVGHPITDQHAGWVPFALELVVPPTSQTIHVGFSVTGAGEVSIRHIAIHSASKRGDAMSPEAEGYLLQALKLIHDSSLKRDSIDWEQLRDYLFLKARHAQHSSDTYDALRVALNVLGDHHSRLLLPEEVQQLQSPAILRAPQVRLTSEGIAILTIPAFDGLSSQSVRNYTKAIARPLADAAGKARCGWVIDLRTDSGGNMWPMLGVVAPFLQNGKLGAFQYRDHADAWTLENDVLFDGATAASKALPHAARLQHARIAVLVGANTTSSGEAIAIALHGRPDTRFFGTATGGLATSVDFDELGDKAVLLVVAAVDVDRNGVAFTDRLVPDEQIEVDRLGSRDETMLAAQNWLLLQCRS